MQGNSRRPRAPAPVLRLGAPNGVSPSAQSLEMPYLVDDVKIIAKLRELLT